MPIFSQLVEIRIGITANEVLLNDPVSQSMARISLESQTIQSQDFEVTSLAQANDHQQINFKGINYSIDRATLQRLAQAPAQETAYLDGLPFLGAAVTLASVDAPGGPYLYMARKAGFGLETYRMLSDGSLQPLQILGDTPDSHLRTISAMAQVKVGAQTWLLTASSSENGVSLLSVGSDGRLTVSGAFGFAEQLPITTPTDIAVVEVAGHSYAVLTAFGTGSVTVLEITAAGDLIFRDQVNDSRNTRFDGASEIATYSQGDMHLVAVAGTDGGFSLFQLLPGGRLLHRETVIDSEATALQNVTGLTFAMVSGRLELFAVATGDGGLSRFSISTDLLGVTATGQNGSAGNDVLTAAPGGGLIQAGAGSDVILDGDGTDTLWGGQGEDIFIFRPDGKDDRIGDFNAAEDRLDFSAYQFVHDPSAISYLQANSGGVVTIGDEDLIIFTSDSRTLTRSDLDRALLLTSDRVLIPDPLSRQGSDTNDIIEAGLSAETIDGGSGFDTVTYRQANSAVQVDLAASISNAGAAQGHVLVSIEAIIGSEFNDVLRGDAGANALTGGSGHDTLLGNSGADWLTPGSGSDSVDGGDGSDMVSFVDLDAAVIVDLAAGTARSGVDTDLLVSIENVTGTLFGDFIQGDDQDNRLRGLGNYDWFIGSDGADTIEGGAGRDMISYTNATSGVTVNLALNKGTAGQAAGDVYDSIERATGSIHSDLFYGDDQANDFRGLGGYDWFIGSGGGKDRYDGGSGLDTVSYANSSAGVAASLLLGRGLAGDADRDLYTSIERLTGSSFDDLLTGDNGRNVLRGMHGRDTLFGNGGVDRLEGGGSDDYLDGGSGWDYAVFSGNRAEYTITQGSLGITVHHNAGNEGTDTLFNIEALQFADDILFV
ncbi:MAG: calcium-binding protein [Roseovarius sp.]|nr:calcium-binding protein [Roseovarius sp.]